MQQGLGGGGHGQLAVCRARQLFGAVEAVDGLFEKGQRPGLQLPGHDIAPLVEDGGAGSLNHALPGTLLRGHQQWFALAFRRAAGGHQRGIVVDDGG